MAAKSKAFNKGEIILMQGDSLPHMIYLSKGSVEILSASQEYSGLNPKIVLEHSTRVSLITEPSFLLGISGKTVRASDQCEVQFFQTPNGFTGLSIDEPGTAISLLLHLFRRVEMSTADLQKIQKLYQNICIVSDNLALIAKELSAGELPERISSRAEMLYETFKKSGGVIPKKFDPQFLLTDRGASLQKKYQIPGEPVESVLDRDLYEFFKRFARIDKNITAHLSKADPEITGYMYTRVSTYLVKIFDKITILYDSINEEMDILYGAEDSWSRYLGGYGAFADWTRSGRLSDDFEKTFAALSAKIYTMLSNFTGKDANPVYAGLDMLKKRIAVSANVKQTAAAAGGQSSERALSPSSDNISRLYTNSLQQILEFAVMPNDFCTQFMKLLNEFRKQENPFSPDDEQRKSRRQITKLYWQLYSMVYIRSLSEKQIPAPVKLLLLFGFVDERLMDPDQIESLHNLSQQSFSAGVPILHEVEFLLKIHSAEEPPSLNEVGLTYEKQLREETDKASKSGQPDGNDPLKKVDYEIQNRLQSTVGICSGSRSTAFPILTSHLIKGNPESFYASKKKVQEILQELLSYDYSAFYRETVTKVNEPIIMEEEVLPYISLLPSFGTKTMMWQEIVGTNKRSRARIMIPIFFMGDLKRSLAHSIASFRWEINRALQGAMWADPVEGGLTGAYYDYVQFFKKNSKLSTEAKEKLHERIKGVRNNMKELFCEDYVTWLLFERVGTMKLNSVVRDIFYRYVPFKKEIRDNLETMPAFVELAQKFKNVRMRKFREYDNKFKKYRDASGNLPEMFQKFMDYLKV